jgi:A/G-specific adenine glycosylase
LKSFQQDIIHWFRAEGRSYPWRETQDPYAILVSEMMLQQTQIATVLGRGYYVRWMAAFPDVQRLAAAPEAEVLRLWEGLGYYARARNLQKTAQAIVALHDGHFPHEITALRALPGLGEYTAGAVATFAFDLPEPIVDANIARVLARLHALERPIDSTAGKAQLWAWAREKVPAQHARAYNSGLMELGQRLCTPRQPQCEICPVQRHCASVGKNPERLPLKQKRAQTVFSTEHVLWCQIGPNVLLCQESGKRRQGLWKLPERPEAWFTEHLCPLIHRSNYTITHHRVKLLAYQIKKAPALLPGESWQPLSSLKSLPMPSPYRRAIQAIYPH